MKNLFRSSPMEQDILSFEGVPTTANSTMIHFPEGQSWWSPSLPGRFLPEGRVVY